VCPADPGGVSAAAGVGRSAGDALRSRADTLRARRTPFVEATVVRAVKPTSAKAGDRALVLPDGTIEGFVGGACAESSVRLHGLRVLRGREPVMLRIIPDAPRVAETGGAGGDRGGTFALEPGQRAGANEDVAAEGLVTVANPCASGGMLEIFLEGVFPPPLVQIRGDAPIARALRALGEALGYDIRPVGGPGGPVSPDAAAVIVASHGREEEPLLTAALEAGVPYVGLVASRRRGAQVVAALGVSSRDRDRLHTPAGLDIGARTPGEIALSIFAEIIAERQRPYPAPRPSASAVVGHHEPAVEPGVGWHADAVLREMKSPAGSGPRGAGTAAAEDAADAAAPAVILASPAEATDPVCGMTVAVTRATPQMTHDGRMWFFCGPGCRQAFADDPARYQG
jgi:xanthine dehydrogenase accessory factor